MPKIIKKQKQKYPAEINRHFGVVLEDINSKMSLVLEGHHVLDKKIDVFKKEFIEFKEETNAKFNIMGKRMDTMGEDIGSLKQDMVIVKSKLTSIENQLKQKVDINQFEQLEQRVIRLEKIAAR